MIYRSSTIHIQHAPRPRPQLTCAGPHSTANEVLGWAVSIKAGRRQLSLTAVPTSDTHTDRQIDRNTVLLRFAAKICSAQF